MSPADLAINAIAGIAALLLLGIMFYNLIHPEKF